MSTDSATPSSTDYLPKLHFLIFYLPRLPAALPNLENPKVDLQLPLLYSGCCWRMVSYEASRLREMVSWNGAQPYVTSKMPAYTWLKRGIPRITIQTRSSLSTVILRNNRHIVTCSHDSRSSRAESVNVN